MSNALINNDSPLGSQEITVNDLHARLQNNEDILIIDVREDWELEKAKLPFAKHIPMGQISLSIDEFDKNSEIIIMCHSGIRSMVITQLLKEQGFAKVKNLKGGINAWSVHIDTSVPCY